MRVVPIGSRDSSEIVVLLDVVPNAAASPIRRPDCCSLSDNARTLLPWHSTVLRSSIVDLLTGLLTRALSRYEESDLEEDEEGEEEDEEEEEEVEGEDEEAGDEEGKFLVAPLASSRLISYSSSSKEAQGRGRRRRTCHQEDQGRSRGRSRGCR